MDSDTSSNGASGEGPPPITQPETNGATDKAPGLPRAIDTGGQPPPGPERGPDGKFLSKDGKPVAEPGPSTVTPPTPAPPKKWRLGDHEFENPDELASAAERLRQEHQQAKAYQQYVEEAAKREAKARSLEARLKKNPFDVLREAGQDPDALAMARVRQMMEQERRFEGMQPEHVELVKRAEATEATLAKERAERQSEKDDAQRQAMQLFQQSRTEHYIGVINKTFEVTPGLPKTGEVQTRLIAEMKRNLKYKYAIPPEQLGRKVLEDLQREHGSWDTDERFSAKDYVKRYPQRAEAIRAVIIAELQAGQAQPPQGQRAPAPLARDGGKAEPRQELLTPEEADILIRKRINS